MKNILVLLLLITFSFSYSPKITVEKTGISMGKEMWQMNKFLKKGNYFVRERRQRNEIAYNEYKEKGIFVYMSNYYAIELPDDDVLEIVKVTRRIPKYKIRKNRI